MLFLVIFLFASQFCALNLSHDGSDGLLLHQKTLGIFLSSRPLSGFSNISVHVQVKGFTYDPCKSSGDCRHPRKCTVFNNKFAQVPCNKKNATFGCSCKWNRTCKKRQDCPRGEVCAALEILPGIRLGNSCVSEIVALDKPELVTVKNGLTMEKCRRNFDCRRNRNCVVDGRKKLRRCRINNKKCVCFPQSKSVCSSSSQCKIGERCATLKHHELPFCISDDALKNRKDISSIGGALGLESCTRKTDCAGDRSCLLSLKEGVDFCTGRRGCFCGYADQQCSAHGRRRCYKGEICVGTLQGEITRCASILISSNNPSLTPISKKA